MDKLCSEHNFIIFGSEIMEIMQKHNLHKNYAKIMEKHIFINYEANL